MLLGLHGVVDYSGPMPAIAADSVVFFATAKDLMAAEAGLGEAVRFVVYYGHAKLPPGLGGMRIRPIQDAFPNRFFFW